MLLPKVAFFFSLSALSGADQIPLTAPDASPFTPDFDKLVTDTLDYWHTPGISVAVVAGDKTFSKGYGIATFPDEKVTPSTLFYTGSTTKSFTAAAVSLLIDDTANSSNPLTWQTPLSSLIREDFVLPDEWATSHVTLEDALSHRTGMPDHDLSWGTLNTTVRDAVRKLRHLRMTAEPRTKWQYCNLMYITITHFIETYTSNWLSNILRDRIWEPLGMKDTFFSLSDSKAATYTGNASLARGYVWLNRTQEYRSVSYMDSDAVSGAGAIISNVLDYAKWLRCMMTMAAPLSQAAHNSLRFPRINIPAFGIQNTGLRVVHGYALGWFISYYRGEVMLWHTGSLGGFATMMAYLPRRNWGFTIMANDMEGGKITHQILSYQLLDDLLGTPQSERLSWSATIDWDLRNATEVLRDPTKHLYADAPLGDSAIPLTLSLSHYTGRYTHLGYPNFTLITKPNLDPSLHMAGANHKEILHTDSYMLSGPVSIDFTHASGEYFVIYIRILEETRQPGDYEPMRDMVSKAEFRLGENGAVKELGLQLQPEMGDDKIWFTKVE